MCFLQFWGCTFGFKISLIKSDHGMIQLVLGTVIFYCINHISQGLPPLIPKGTQGFFIPVLTWMEIFIHLVLKPSMEQTLSLSHDSADPAPCFSATKSRLLLLFLCLFITLTRMC